MDIEIIIILSLVLVGLTIFLIWTAYNTIRNYKIINAICEAKGGKLYLKYTSYWCKMHNEKIIYMGNPDMSLKKLLKIAEGKGK